MEKLTYRQAFDKITEAYIRGEIIPVDSNFCFCGTLSPNRGEWNQLCGFSYGNPKPDFLSFKYKNEEPYTLWEYKQMEWALINNKNEYAMKNNVDYAGEDALFAGMCAALEVLKEIHRARGEDVDEVPVFTKRELLTPAHQSGIKN